MATQRSRRRGRWTRWMLPPLHAHGTWRRHGRAAPGTEPVRRDVEGPVVSHPESTAEVRQPWSAGGERDGHDGRDTVEPQVDADRFVLQGRIGAGNHGVVFRALDQHLGRQVAIKRFSHFLADDPRAMRRITREVETLARVSHPSVVTVHDLVRMPDGDGEVTPHLVMELVEGTSLRDLLSLRGPSPRSVTVVLAVLDGLAACHRAGILHLDIKPANVLVTTTGGTKIVDFGIARAASDATATVAGTPHYMAPEQYDGRADERSDVYSVGCLLYECLTGRPPFEGTMAAQLMAHRTQPRPDPRTLAPWVGPRLADVVRTAMAVEPDARYAGVDAMAAALSAAAGDVDATRVGERVAEPPPTQRTPTPVPVATPRPVAGPGAGPVTGPLVRPLSRPSDLGDRRLAAAPTGATTSPAQPGESPAPPSHVGPSVTRWTRLVSLVLGIGASSAVVAFVPMVAWGSLDLVDPRMRPAFMDDLSADAWWMVAVAIALVYLLLRREEFFSRLAGPPVGDPLPDGPLAPTARRGITMALSGAVRGSLPLLLPWYVLGLSGLVLAAGLTWPDDPFASFWTTTWVMAPLVALVLAVRGVTGMRPRLGAMTLSLGCLLAAGGAAAYFVLGSAFVA